MATLTQTAYFARKAIKYGGISLVVLILLRASYITIKRLVPPKPKPPAPPNIAFGKLPKLVFPENANLPTINYRLETISGTLPVLASQAKVYFIPQPITDVLSWDKTIVWARNLGFDKNPKELSKFDYQFVNDQSPPTTLNVSVLNRDFTYLYDWKNDIGSISEDLPPPESDAIEMANAFMQQAQSLGNDIDQTKTKVVYLRNDNGNLIKSIFAEANFARANYFRQDLDQLKILPANPDNSNINVVVSPSKNRNQGILEAKFVYFPISKQNSATYPIKDVNQAWEQLVSGKGHIASLGDNGDGNVIIRNAYLAYFDSENIQNFLQPIIVFEGDRGFIAYVPAISDSLILAQ